MLKPTIVKNIFNSFQDERGFLSTSDISNIYEALELNDFDFRYQLVSSNISKNTFRGFHYQTEPYEQVKIVLVHSGTILDFVFPYKSPLEENIECFELSVGDVIAIPSNYAHGFYSLSDNVLLQYIMNNEYSASCYKGINGNDFIKNRFNDKKVIISKKDSSLPKKLIKSLT